MAQPQQSTPLLQQPPQGYDYGYMRKLIGLLNRFLSQSKTSTDTGALTGDLSGSLLAPVVVGIQTIPVSSTAPSDGQVLTYVAADGKWEPSVGGSANRSILVNSTGVSDDYTITVNATSQVLVNGS